MRDTERSLETIRLLKAICADSKTGDEAKIRAAALTDCADKLLESMSFYLEKFHSKRIA